MPNTFRSITALLPAAADQLRRIQDAYRKGGDDAPLLTDVLAVYVKFLRIRGIADRARRNVEEGLRYKVNDLIGALTVDNEIFSHNGEGFVRIKYPYEMSDDEKAFITTFYDRHIQPKIPQLWQTYSPTEAPAIRPNAVKFDGVYDLENQGIDIPEMTYGTELTDLKLLGRHGKNQAFDAPTFIDETHILAGQRPEGAWAMPGGFTEGAGKQKGFGELVEEVFTGTADFCELGSPTGEKLNSISRELFIGALTKHVQATTENTRAALHGTPLRGVLGTFLASLQNSPAPNIDILAQLIAAIEGEKNRVPATYAPLREAVNQLIYQCKTTVFSLTPDYLVWKDEWVANTLNGKRRPNYSDGRNTSEAAMETTAFGSFYTRAQLAKKYQSLGFTAITGGDDIKSAKIAHLDQVVNGVPQDGTYGVEHATFSDHPEIVMSMYRKGILEGRLNPQSHEVIDVVNNLITRSLEIYDGLAARYREALPYMPGKTPVTPRRAVMAAAAAQDNTPPVAPPVFTVPPPPAPARAAATSHPLSDDPHGDEGAAREVGATNFFSPISVSGIPTQQAAASDYPYGASDGQGEETLSQELEELMLTLRDRRKKLNARCEQQKETGELSASEKTKYYISTTIGQLLEAIPIHLTPKQIPMAKAHLNTLRHYLRDLPLEQTFGIEMFGTTYPDLFSDNPPRSHGTKAKSEMPAKGSMFAGTLFSRTDPMKRSFEDHLLDIAAAAQKLSQALAQTTRPQLRPR